MPVCPLLTKVSHFYPRPPRGGRHFRRYRYGDPIGFLSTPSARRATIAPFTIPVLQIYFYPRPPRGGRLSHPSRFLFYRFISIHALREEGDLIVRLSVESSIIFLSTPSARRATTSSTTYTITQLISIHALREEGDPSSQGPLLCL